MKLINIVQSYKNLEPLSQINDYHIQEQKLIYNLRKELRSEVEFYNNRVSALKEKYKPFANQEGILEGEKYFEYMAEIEELNNFESEADIQKIKLPFVDGITFLTAETLENVIEFE